MVILRFRYKIDQKKYFRIVIWLFYFFIYLNLRARMHIDGLNALGGYTLDGVKIMEYILIHKYINNK